MSAALQTSVGVGMAAAGWLATRRCGVSTIKLDRWIALDIFVPALLCSLLIALSARPLFSGFLTFAFGTGYAYAERAKRNTLSEPIVFTDVFQSIDIARHPQLAMPFPNPAPILVTGIVVSAVFCMLFFLEREVPGTRGYAAVGVFVLTGVAVYLHGPGGPVLVRALREAGLRGDPASDAQRFGVLGCLLAYGLAARVERETLRCTHAPLPILSNRDNGLSHRTPMRPLLLVQCESFFDARRIGGGLVPDLLPAFDIASTEGLQYGRLRVPCWGANTVRTEFAVLTGLDAEDIGFDRFNPYHRFARQPVDSLAWKLRQRGYTTVCVHPFDRRFYSRDRVMPKLGFERFLGEEAFIGAPRINGYVCDESIAEVVESLIAEYRGAVFVFVVTLENHGPWSGAPRYSATRYAPGVRLPPDRQAAVERYLSSLRNGDALLGTLMSRGADGRLIGFYGDHQPSLRLGPVMSADNSSDYVLWQADQGHQKTGVRCDLAAEELAARFLSAVDAQRAEVDAIGAFRCSSSHTTRSS